MKHLLILFALNALVWLILKSAEWLAESAKRIDGNTRPRWQFWRR